MKRFGRYFFRLMVVGSVVLSGLVAVIWWRSYAMSEGVHYLRPERIGWEVASRPGGIDVGVFDYENEFWYFRPARQEGYWFFSQEWGQIINSSTSWYEGPLIME